MSDVATWAAVGVSCVALGWTALVDQQRRRDAKRQERETHDNAKRQEQAVIDSAIARVIAQWSVTRLKDVSYSADPNLDELKQSAARWRAGCAEPLAIIPRGSSAYALVEDTVKAASDFERIIDPMREDGVPVNSKLVQESLDRLQPRIWDAISKLSSLGYSRGPAASRDF